MLILQETEMTTVNCMRKFNHIFKLCHVPVDATVTTKNKLCIMNLQGLGPAIEKGFISSIQKAHDSNIQDKKNEHIIQSPQLHHKPKAKIHMLLTVHYMGVIRIQYHENCPYRPLIIKEIHSPKIQIKSTCIIPNCQPD